MASPDLSSALQRRRPNCHTIDGFDILPSFHAGDHEGLPGAETEAFQLSVCDIFSIFWSARRVAASKRSSNVCMFFFGS